MRHTVTMPRLADSAIDVFLVKWLVEVGDVVAAGEPLVQVETAKAEQDVDCPVAGKVAELLVDEGVDVPAGTPIAVVVT